jgi:hypothetical protein
MDYVMTLKRLDQSRQDGERLQLPASSWWIPSLTAAVALLAILTAWT